MECLSLSSKSTAQEQIIGVLQTNLSIDSNGDFYIVLAEAEKVRPHTYLDVLRDPYKEAEAVLKEIEAF